MNILLALLRAGADAYEGITIIASMYLDIIRENISQDIQAYLAAAAHVTDLLEFISNADVRYMEFMYKKGLNSKILLLLHTKMFTAQVGSRLVALGRQIKKCGEKENM